MQFIKDGPDIPEALLLAHEEGRVIFFCGAGISYPAGLPDFKGLVEKLYKELNTEFLPIEREAFGKYQYDAALDLLERRYPGRRHAVRTALMRVLKPNLRLKRATDTHKALLELAHDRHNAVRLVTTNFDRIFLRLMGKSAPKVPLYPAPFLPIPKNSRWNGVVYLHGLLPETSEESQLNRLVLSSGDFGLAYLTERWASRFVSELFRNYIVCFVGYSINDPVLRYMMDALAADRMLGEVTPQAFAFGDTKPGEQAEKRIEWEAKGVTPILYEVAPDDKKHLILHQTLKAWSETYRDGIRGKQQIVAQYAMARPLSSTKQDDFVGRLIWALSDNKGLPAKHFAELNPVPSLEWLEPFCDERYRHSDLERFGVVPKQQLDEKLAFSLISRPSPYTHAPWMSLVVSFRRDGVWDDVMLHLARWLSRHLNDPALLWWFVKRGAHLHSHLKAILEHQLDHISKLETGGNSTELENIRSNAANAIPSKEMRTLWRLVLSDRVRAQQNEPDFYRWKNLFLRDGATSSVRYELRTLLSPKLLLREPFRWRGESTVEEASRKLKDFIGWDVVLSANYADLVTKELAQLPAWQEVLPDFIDDFKIALRDALDLMQELGEADKQSSRSHWDLPSISPHWQNRGFRDWVVPIELLRDAWLAIAATNPIRAAGIAHDWWLQPYPAFKRLALFASTQCKEYLANTWVDWLLSDNSWWLWSVETQRETMRALVLLAANLPSAELARVESSILAGPPRDMFRSDLQSQEWQALLEHTIWLHLAKLISGGVELGQTASERFQEISSIHPTWKLEDDRDEFSHWMSGTGDPDFKSPFVLERAPRRRRELMTWLMSPRPEGPFNRSDWGDICRENFPLAACALGALGKEDSWPTDYWRDALQVWSAEIFLRRSWRYLARVLQKVPDEVLLGISGEFTWWLEAQSKVFLGQDEIFFSLNRQVLSLNYPDMPPEEEVMTYAINHPVGRVTQALLNCWFRDTLEDGQGLSASLKGIFSSLCDITIKQYLSARVLLASNVVALFRVDQAWTEQYLLPNFSWESSKVEAAAAWEGFLWSPRLYRPLLAKFKSEFLDTANHYAELGERGRQYANILTYAAFDSADTFTYSELQSATEKLPPEGLIQAARALVGALSGAGEQREIFWANRIKPYWQGVWPKSVAYESPAIADQLAQLAITAGNAFPDVLSVVQAWLKPLDHPDHVVLLLSQSNLCDQYPRDALILLHAIIEEKQWAPMNLQSCLSAIGNAWPSANTDFRYRSLLEYLERRKIQ
ncbi:SIR2 family protein [Rhodanobacter sp. 7MK24]|uniref:anti-phage defense-associated sirtuin Dsr1 n=1 Tax=Rhodanobacter sp. 7MK24 TaxID=2775922 RepID=UPI0017827B16|nr:anti-phage defense-associated sirtuin Dsr1 [Rhodanobacter sp. 7MK24]MBD8880867.1 SIR2 family protein [Rhodanobacter sp. 7MK24]